jgi:hypothetical protein
MPDTPGLKALTVRQPWGTAIARWDKRVENRTWLTTHRGLLAIHTGGSWDRSAEHAHTLTNAFARHSGANRTYIDSVYTNGLDPRDDHMFPRSAIIAVATITGCHQCADGSCSPWAIAGQWHWELADVHALARPVPTAGRLGLWAPTPEVAAAVTAQLTTGAVHA